MLMDLEPMMRAFEDKMATAVQDAVRGLTSQARTELGRVVAAAEQARARGEAELEAKRAALEAELAAMQRVEYAQDTRVELDVGGRRFVTSVATLRSKPGTMLDAMFSGRYLVDKTADGSVFWTATGACLVTCWSTCGTAWCRWRRRARRRAATLVCCVV